MYNEALNIFHQWGYPDNHYRVLDAERELAGFYLAIDSVKKAETIIEKVYKIANEKFIGVELITFLFAMADYNWHYGKAADADSIFQKIIETTKNLVNINFPFFSEVEKAKLWDIIGNYFEIFNSFAIEQKFRNPYLLGMMYNNQLFSKAILLNSTKKLREFILKSDDSVLISKMNGWRETLDKIAKLYQNPTENIKKTLADIDSLYKEANNYEKQLSKKVNIISKEKQDVSWLDIQSKLKEDEAAIEIIRFKKYCFTPNKKNSSISFPNITDTIVYAALIITKKTKDYPKIIVLENGNELENDSLLHNYYSLNRINQKINPQSIDKNKPYFKYWKPITDELKGIRKIYFSPDGIYSTINPQTIFNPFIKMYLFDEYDFIFLNSSKDLIGYLMLPESPIDRPIQLFGNPDFDLNNFQKTNQILDKSKQDFSNKNESLSSNKNITKWEPLPVSEEEINDIYKIFKSTGFNVNKFLGTKALENTIKKIKSPSILHISTHALFYPKNAKVNKYLKEQYFNPLLNSYIALAGANNLYDKTYLPDILDDGRLTAFEAMNLDLEGTELVVLSACETGLGENINGEGVYGLTRAFQIAGAKSVIQSMWGVEDEDTKDLMRLFYKKWIRNKDKHAAFLEAQKEMIKKNTKPSSWGAFVMVGG